MYTVYFLPKFKSEFSNFPKDQQNRILEFITTFESHGLSDFSKYEGKIAPSWSNLDRSHPDYSYCRQNQLWHYHLGIPEYRENHRKYKTSEWVLHFQWPDRGNHINIVDIYTHENVHGGFYIPGRSYLDR